MLSDKILSEERVARDAQAIEFDFESFTNTETFRSYDLQEKPLSVLSSYVFPQHEASFWVCKPYLHTYQKPQTVNLYQIGFYFTRNSVGYDFTSDPNVVRL